MSNEQNRREAARPRLLKATVRREEMLALVD